MKNALSLILMVVSFAAIAQDNSEDIFRKAQAYTVRIKTSVPVPFSGDSRGILIGAGFVVDAGRCPRPGRE